MAKTIFVVDDSATILMSVKNNLEISGYTVHSATDGVLALEKLKSGLKPDLIITAVSYTHLTLPTKRIV